MKKIFSILISLLLLASSAFAYTPISRIRNFVNDKNNGIPITSSYMDSELNQLVSAANGTLVVQASAPSSPFAGQFWYDSTNKLLKQFRNNEWVVQGILHVGTSSPTTSQAGDVWYDSTNKILRLYEGGQYGTFASLTSGGGNVGVGTFSANAKLQVRPGTNQNFIVAANNLLSDGISVSSVNDANGANLGFEARGTTVQLSAIGANPIQFYTNGSQRAVITSGGNVGIGTAAPGKLLDVAGAIRMTAAGGITFSDSTNQTTAPTAPGLTLKSTNSFSTGSDSGTIALTASKTYKIVAKISRSNNAISMTMLFNGDSGTHYGNVGAAPSSSANISLAANISSSSDMFLNFDIIPSQSTAQNVYAIGSSLYTSGATGNVTLTTISNYYVGTASVTSFIITPSAGTITGTIWVYEYSGT